MAITDRHITTLANFIDARLFRPDQIDEFRDSGGPARSQEEGARRLRALQGAVLPLQARHVFLKDSEKYGLTHEQAFSMAAVAWDGLQAIASQWSDHPDYLPWFASSYNNLDAAQVESAKPSEGTA